MSIKIGFGLYYHMLNNEHFEFARQCGATHLVIHLVDYFNNGIQDKLKNKNNQPIGNNQGWGIAGSNLYVWETEWLQELQENVSKFDLKIEAIENFDPIDWYDILLGGELRDKQLEIISKRIVNVSNANIPIIGYNFSLAGVAGREISNSCRGYAKNVVMNKVDDTPILQGMIWNMIYNSELYQKKIPQNQITLEKLWENYEWFITRIIPIAEKNNIRLALHPDDPPVTILRKQPRLVYKAELYNKVLDYSDSSANSIELCLGTLQEMKDTDVYFYLEQFLKKDKIAYIHYRNVNGKVPNYKEVFIDEGDLNMIKVMEILKKNNFNGMIIPDHTPQMSCNSSWHAGMAYAMGYINALVESVK